MRRKTRNTPKALADAFMNINGKVDGALVELRYSPIAHSGRWCVQLNPLTGAGPKIILGGAFPRDPAALVPQLRQWVDRHAWQDGIVRLSNDLDPLPQPHAPEDFR